MRIDMGKEIIANGQSLGYEAVDCEILAEVTGRNEEGALRYVLKESYKNKEDIILEIYKNKKLVTEEFIRKVLTNDSLAEYRGGRATRLACDFIKKLLQTQEKSNECEVSKQFLIYAFNQIEIVCKEIREDVLGVRSMDIKTQLKNFKNDEKQNKEKVNKEQINKDKVNHGSSEWF